MRFAFRLTLAKLICASRNEQVVKPIHRAKGTTKSEIFLGSLADHTFLDLWSYPNVFISPGKELCDLLVVCGNHVIIFSDKSISWPKADLGISWPRWYNKAIVKSVAQIRGANRWLTNPSNQIYLDAQCKIKLPIELPPTEDRVVHGICVALGAEAASNEFFNDDDGSFIILPHLQGVQHVNFNFPEHLPFAIGDIDPKGPFVHVFDQPSLTIVMQELDTITDFTRYLTQRKYLIRSKSLFISPSESEMLANYMQTAGPDGYQFPDVRDFDVPTDFRMSFAQGEYLAFKTSAEYAVIQAQKNGSYVWDKLIKLFTGPVLAGTTEKVLDIEPSVKLSEQGLRIMAAEPRKKRVALGRAIVEAAQNLKMSGKERYTRIIFPMSSTDGVPYIFMFLAVPNDTEIDYARYRQTRIVILETYCYAFLKKYRSYQKVVGIAMNSPEDRGSSEDLIVIESPEWTSELLVDLEERCEHFEILQENNLEIREVK